MAQSAKKKCVHVVATPDYSPELCSITLPTIRGYANRIGADFNLISTRKFPSFPVNYERMQIHEAGASYEWNINIDADMIIGKALPDITDSAHAAIVRIVMKFDADAFFNINDDVYFKRDGRNAGIVDAFVVTSRLTHDLWEPLAGTFTSYSPVFKDGNTRRISEYCISRNLAKYGLQFTGAFARADQIFHLGYTSGSAHDAIKLAQAKAREWGW